MCFIDIFWLSHGFTLGLSCFILLLKSKESRWIGNVVFAGRGFFRFHALHGSILKLVNLFSRVDE